MNDNIKWFKEAKYGMFIHWGLYSLLAGEHNGEDAGVYAEWIQNAVPFYASGAGYGTVEENG